MTTKGGLPVDEDGTIRCTAPGCEATCVAKLSTDRNEKTGNFFRNVPAGWHMDIVDERIVVLCPPHAQGAQ